MKNYLYTNLHDLVTPDGYIKKIVHINEKEAEAEVFIDEIPAIFVGFDVPEKLIFFNFKSTLAQLGLNGVGTQFLIDKQRRICEVKVKITSLGPIAEKMLSFLRPGAFIGKLFVADERRKVKQFHYLERMFHRFDRQGRPLLLFGERGNSILHFETVDGRAVAFLELKKGKNVYDKDIYNTIPTLAKALEMRIPLRELVRMHQLWMEGAERKVVPDEMLLVSTHPLHVRTCFGRVIEELLPAGFHHTSANVLEPSTTASGDIYEFFGNSPHEIFKIPLEFYTLEPHREHVFFSDRDQLLNYLDKPEIIFNVFKTAPRPLENRAALFIVKGSQINRIRDDDWITRPSTIPELNQISDPTQYAAAVEEYIERQPSYPFLQAIEDNLITSQGVLFTRFFPSPLLKAMLLSYYVRTLLKRIYFQYPSSSHGYYFSQEDRAFLNDLTSFGISIYWADELSSSILRYVQRPGKTSGMFVPLNRVELFKKATFFGIYGSNLLEGNFENELKAFLEGILKLKSEFSHPLFHKDTPLALVTGGGPGAMEVGNRMAKELDILSCAHIVDFTQRDQAVINEQRQNPYVEAKMTYRLDRLVERQAEFYLDFPIFVTGGIGTDFEFALEEVRHKVGGRPAAPVILFGKPEYWKKKITSRFQCNVESGTIVGSEWLSNTLFCIQNAEQGLKVFRSFFEGKLVLGKNGPIYNDGFVTVT